MANSNHLDILRLGVAAWNQWREENAQIRPDLSGADISGTESACHDQTREVFLHGERLYWSNLPRIDLHDADLSQANLSQAYLAEANFGGADLTEANLSQSYLVGADLSHASLSKARLAEADLSQANLWGAYLKRAVLQNAILVSCTLAFAKMDQTILEKAALNGANLPHAELFDANLVDANLSKADLRHADLNSADLFRADLRSAHLGGANLSHASLVEANVEGTNFANSRVYGVAVWGLIGCPSEQSNLIITRSEDSNIITVDDLEVAQFVYLLLNYRKLRTVISTVAERAVLLLGRFTDDRRPILEAIAEKLREWKYLPIIFDFKKVHGQDYTETIQTLAGLSKFIIADITKPRSVQQEAQAIVPNFKIPFVQVIQKGEEPWSMSGDLSAFDWVLGVAEYTDKQNLIEHLEKVVNLAEKKHQELIVRKAMSVVKATPIGELLRENSP